jgi:dephospho-CoA kinase
VSARERPRAPRERPVSAGAEAADDRVAAHRPIRIGLTGPIGCGKSTVAGWLGKLGARVIDADLVAREVTPPGSAELAAVVGEFGPAILRPDGSLDRAALGRIVFADPAALARLEVIIHPAVRPRIILAIGQAEQERPRAVVIEAIKLVEGGLATLCDEVWLVTCEPAEQLARLAARNDAARDAQARIAPQADTEARIAPQTNAESRIAAERDAEARIAAQAGLVDRLRPFATRVIDTSGSIADSRSRVAEAWSLAIRSQA